MLGSGIVMVLGTGIVMGGGGGGGITILDAFLRVGSGLRSSGC